MTKGFLRTLRPTTILIFLAVPAFAVEKAVPLTTFATLPVKEITVFKDGHAFVAHEGDLSTDEHGIVRMDYLPTPVVGTFWPYTSTGANVDLAITTAMDVRVRKSESETKRAANAMQENGNFYSRIDLAGKISLTSHRAQPTEIEITRHVLGAADSADHNGKVELNLKRCSR